MFSKIAYSTLVLRIIPKFNNLIKEIKESVLDGTRRLELMAQCQYFIPAPILNVSFCNTFLHFLWLQLPSLTDYGPSLTRDYYI